MQLRKLILQTHRCDLGEKNFSQQIRFRPLIRNNKKKNLSVWKIPSKIICLVCLPFGMASRCMQIDKQQNKQQQKKKVSHGGVWLNKLKFVEMRVSVEIGKISQTQRTWTQCLKMCHFYSFSPLWSEYTDHHRDLQGHSYVLRLRLC